ncbi:MAG: glycosyltransferase family 4 protein [Aggregatilineales bacterium]
MSRRLFVASGIFHPEPGGPATYLRAVLPRLQARGWQIHALTFSDAPSGPPEPYPVTRIVRRAYPLRMAAYARAARPLLGWADLVFIHQPGLPLIGSRRAPRILKVVGDVAWERAIRKGWIPFNEDIDVFQTRCYGLPVSLDKARLAREVQAMDAIIVPSAYLKRMVVGWGANAAQVHLIYNAPPPDEALAAAGALPQAEARARLGLLDAPLVLVVGRLLPWKGVDHLIAALAAVPAIHLLVAGDGPALAQARALAARVNVADRVTFLGRLPREQIPLYMRAADYVALYSGYEGLSHTLLESLRVGTPVIASDKGGNPEIVQHGVNGLLVPYIDLEALQSALDEAFWPGRRAALAAETGVGLDRFDFDHMVDATEALLRAIAG